jgi:hypothetical protein
MTDQTNKSKRRQRQRKIDTEPQQVEVEPVAAAAPAPVGNDPLESGVVSDGRSVHIPVPGQQTPCGYDMKESKTVFRSVFEVFGPGETVTLPRSEIARLKNLGFLRDPSRTYPISTFNAQTPASDQPGLINGKTK